MSTEPQHTRGQFLRELANPFHRRGFYVLPHLSAVGVIFLVTFLIYGALAVKVVFDSGYFQHRYQFLGVKTPPPGVSAPIRDVRRPGLAAQASIPRSYYPAVGDQGPLGECAGYASAWDMSYEMRRAGTFGWIRLSPIFEYSYYSDRYSGGQDAGSWPDQDLELLQSTGLPKFKQVPTPPYQILNPLPTTDSTGTPLRMVKASYQIHYISGFAQGGGQGVVDAARWAISSGHGVMWALPVYPEYDNATQQPLIVSPTPGEVSRGGHANVLLAYDDTKVFPDGTVGGFLTQNQWTKQWGSGGRAWVSYDFVRRYSFGLEYITLGASAPHAGKTPPWDKGMQHTPKTFADNPTAPPKATSGWYVDNVYAQDRSLNLAPIINAVGDKVGLWPIGLTSTLRAECALYTTSPQCDRYGPWPDWSHGACQVSVQTAGGFGVGYGNEGSDGYVRNFENNPWNCIKLAARVMKSYINYTQIFYPFAETAWNCGPGNSAYFLYHPTGQCGLNFQHYLPSYYWALAHAWHPK